MPKLNEPPAPSKSVGYTCKAWIAYELEKRYFGQRFYAWYASELNPIGNGDSSNPLMLYWQIDRAVKQNDSNHTKIKDLKAKLLFAVITLVEPKNVALASALRAEIVTASLSMYRPQLWKLDVAKIGLRSTTDGAEPGWDEHLVTDIAEGEFEVVVA
jgi:hypothetical protein